MTDAADVTGADVTDAGAVRHVLLLDGWQHRREGLHWQGWLADALAGSGVTAEVLDLPDPEHPSVDAWSAAVAQALAGRTDVAVVAHGLSVLLWLRMCGDGTAPRVRRVLLVAPPATGAHGGDVSAPLPTSVTAAAVAASADEPVLMVSAVDDEFLPDGAAVYATPLGIAHVELAAGGHLNAAAGFGPWPAALSWCRTGRWPAEDLASAVDRLFEPRGRRLGIVVTTDLTPDGAASAADALERHGSTADRRLARLRPRANEATLRVEDVCDFARKYGHEYALALLPQRSFVPSSRPAVAEAFREAETPVIWVA